MIVGDKDGKSNGKALNENVGVGVGVGAVESDAILHLGIFTSTHLNLRLIHHKDPLEPRQYEVHCNRQFHLLYSNLSLDH